MFNNTRPGKPPAMDLSQLRVLVVDEVDFFFESEESTKMFMEVYKNYLSKQQF